MWVLWKGCSVVSDERSWKIPVKNMLGKNGLCVKSWTRLCKFKRLNMKGQTRTAWIVKQDHK